MAQERVGFIGVGVMGRPMVRNLLKARVPVTIWARRRERVEDVLAAGATWAESPAAVGAGSDVVITMLPNSPEVEAVVLGPNGVLEGLRPGGVVVDMSTIAPAASRRIAAVCAERGVGFLDAPVSGGTVGAAAGTLTIMVGGDRATFERVRPIFEVLGAPENLVHVGPIGSGEVVKLVNNVMAAGIAAAVAEALLLGVKAGVPLETLTRIVGASTGANAQLSTVFPLRVFNGSFALGFATDLMTKDVELALDLGRAIGSPLPVAERVLERFRAAQAAGYGQDDYTSVIRPLEAEAGIEVRQQA
ncbi:MAG: tartronate semialdehyde reductase [Dehalococcoidia bacterium]|nr:MAG: tartronate semialdehyde reductase [Dehalococcoidia bacterium]